VLAGREPARGAGVSTGEPLRGARLPWATAAQRGGHRRHRPGGPRPRRRLLRAGLLRGRLLSLRHQHVDIHVGGQGRVVRVNGLFRVRRLLLLGAPGRRPLFPLVIGQPVLP
jgi:hypothetical protein